jgi:catechol 2,3-dioxygenase-like lactoylglutathione lyase family enzyme
MLADSKAYSGIGVPDIEKAKEFYGETLGLQLEALDEENGLMQIQHPDHNTLLYASSSPTPAGYTVLNFEVDDVEATVDELSSRGVSFERYDQFDQDDRGIVTTGGPRVAWFKDPFGNVLSVLAD